MGKKSPEAPPPPNYAAAATATAAGNEAAALNATAANRVNQRTPYGNLSYTHEGNGPGGWTVEQTLSEGGQNLLNQTNALNNGLMQTANTGLNYANGVLSKPGVSGYDVKMPGSFGQNTQAPGSFGQNMQGPNSFGQNMQGPENFGNGAPTTGFNPGQSYQDAIMSRLSPQIDRENNQSDAQLANQGVMQGSEAYKNAKTALGQQHNDLLNNATVQGMGAGLQANQQKFNQNQNQYGEARSTNQQNFGQNQALYGAQLGTNQQNFGQNQAQFSSLLGTNSQNFNQNQVQYQADNAANAQGFQQTAYNQMQPINVINALRTGSQVQAPSYVNAPQQATVAGPDMMGAAQGQNQYNMGLYNSTVAQNNSNNGLLGSLAAAAGTAY